MKHQEERKVYRFPLGVCNFAEMIADGYIYMDKTHYIPIIENDDKHLMLLRPRRFGKSLFLSTLDYYYNKLHGDKFDSLFKNTYLGKNPTPLKNSFLVLNFDFSGMETDTLADTKNSFLKNVREGFLKFINDYNEYFDEKDEERLFEARFSSELIDIVLGKLNKFKVNEKIYLLIDEYDHFSNRIFSRDSREFDDLLAKGGFLRPFFENLKKGTKTYIKKIFITGILPILLDSLTSGFNIMTNASTYERYNELYGFKQEDVDNILRYAGAENYRELVKEYYNGYTFSENSRVKVYNSDMVLYFANHYAKDGRLPPQLLDYNIITDYGKIEAIVSIVEPGEEREIIADLVSMDTISTPQITQSFSTEFTQKPLFDRRAVITLLYYIGYLTIKEKSATDILLKIPNYMIRSIYFKYIKYLLEKNMKFKVETVRIEEAVRKMANGTLEEYIHLVEDFLEKLSNRDYQNFTEKYIKLSMVALLSVSNIYTIRSESEEKGRYSDLTLKAQDQKLKSFTFELKYKKVEDKKREKEKKIEEGLKQIRRFKNNSKEENMDFYVLMFEKSKCIYKEKV